MAKQTWDLKEASHSAVQVWTTIPETSRHFRVSGFEFQVSGGVAEWSIGPDARHQTPDTLAYCLAARAAPNYKGVEPA